LRAGSRGSFSHQPKTINRFSRFSVKEKDEASLFRVCGMGFDLNAFILRFAGV
jgi:hypothetical protein